MRGWLIALVLGGASAVGFAPLGWWPMTLLCFAGLIALIERAPNMRRALATGWWFGLGHFTIGLNWIATAFYFQDAMPHWLGWVAVVLLSLYLAAYPAVAVGLAWRWGRPAIIPLTLVFSAAWIVTEWLRATMFTGFAWNPLGVALVDIGTITRWIGTYGLSGIAILASGAIAALGVGKWRQSAALAVPFIASALLSLISASPPASDAPAIQIVQPNINQNEKYSDALLMRNIRTLIRLTGRVRDHPRLIFWPEAAIPYYLEEDSEARAAFANLLGPRDILLTGGDTIIRNRKFEPIAATNSLFALDSRAHILARYDKAHLVPYGEYLPMRPILSVIGLSRLVPGTLDFQPGPGPKTFALPGFGQAGIQICYEMIFSGQVIDQAHRPDFLFNPSNDAWFGAWGPPQHLAQARLRAIEEGVPIIRSTPTGISAVIDADGRVLSSIPWHQAGAISATLPPAHQPTLFSRFGNLLPLGLALFLALTPLLLARHRASR
jgi:apolipoprotein N-acyltransferase